jgi:hypothetical protein
VRLPKSKSNYQLECGKNIELAASGLLKLVCAKRDGGGGGVHVLMKNYGRP